MASEYLKWKYRDVRPEEKRELSRAEKRKNWWHYHKWHVVIGGLLLLALADILWHALGIGEVRPDYQIAYVGTAALPADTAAAIEAAFASLGTDANGDGKVVVRLNQYAAGVGGAGEAASYTAASEVRLMGDLEKCDSFFFLLEDPETFQSAYEALSRPDGTLPSSGETAGLSVRWRDCPALAGIALGSYQDTVLGQRVSGDSGELASGLYLARRGFWTERTAENLSECEALWNLLSEGAEP